MKLEKGEPLLERVPVVKKPVAVQKSPPKSVASLGIHSVAEKPSAAKVGFF